MRIRSKEDEGALTLAKEERRIRGTVPIIDCSAYLNILLLHSRSIRVFEGTNVSYSIIVLSYGNQM